jgi:hypothetical protein
MLVLLALLVLVLWFGWHFVMPYTPDFLKGTPVP